jgi:Flp pilus assembly pilin Flp
VEHIEDGSGVLPEQEDDSANKEDRTMSNVIRHFVLDESGLETVEWAIVGGVIVAVGAALFITIGQDTLRGVTALDTQTSKIP